MSTTNSLLCTCTTTALMPDGSVVAGATFSFDLVKPPPDFPDCLSGEELRATSGSDGTVQQELVRGAEFRYRWGNGPWRYFCTPDADAYQLPSTVDGK